MLEILEDETGTLITYPPVIGVPSSVTARVQTPDTDMPDSGSAVAVDSVSATTQAEAAEGAESLSLDCTPQAVLAIHLEDSGSVRRDAFAKGDMIRVTRKRRETLGEKRLNNGSIFQIKFQGARLSIISGYLNRT